MWLAMCILNVLTVVQLTQQLDSNSTCLLLCYQMCMAGPYNVVYHSELVLVRVKDILTILSAWQLREVDCGGLALLSVRMMQTGSSVVWRWNLRESGTDDVQGRLGGIVSRRIWRVLSCPMRMLGIGIIGDWESRGNQLTQVYLESSR